MPVAQDIHRAGSTCHHPLPSLQVLAVHTMPCTAQEEKKAWGQKWEPKFSEMSNMDKHLEKI